MSIILMEGFDVGDLERLDDRRGVNNSLQIFPTGRDGIGKAIQVQGGSQAGRGWEYYFDTGEPNQTIHLAFGAYVPSGSGLEIYAYGDSGATLHNGISTDAAGRVRVHRGTTAQTVIAQTAPGTVQTNTWHHIEVELILSDTVGGVRIWVDGALRTTETNIDTKNGGTADLYDRVRIDGGGSQIIDDFIISTGTTVIGDTIIETLLPNGNGNYSNLVGSDGNSVDNYLLVDQLTEDASEYVGSATPGDKDTYTFSDLSITTGTIVAVEARAMMFKSDAGGPVSGRVIHRRGTTDSVGADKVLATGVVDEPEIWELDPSIAGAWTITNVNASEFGFEVRA